MRHLPAILLLVAALPLAGCSTVGYYSQAVTGHFRLMSARVPIEEVIADPATPEAVRERLRVALAAREFAVTELGLPDNGSYRRYAALDRPAAMCSWGDRPWSTTCSPRRSSRCKRRPGASR